VEAGGVEPPSESAHRWSPTCLAPVCSRRVRYGDNLEPASLSGSCRPGRDYPARQPLLYDAVTRPKRPRRMGRDRP